MSDALTLQESALGCALHFNWFGIKKTATDTHKQEAAQVFDAQSTSLSLSKSLINTKNAHYSALTKIKNYIRNSWLTRTLPWVESGIRLIKKEHVEEFNTIFIDLKDQFMEKVYNFSDNFYEIKNEARAKLGRLYNEGDYPEDVQSQFGVSLDWPNLNAPDHLRTIDPKLFEEEQEKVRKKFEQALELAEKSFAEKLLELLDNLKEKLKPSEDGKKKRFHSSSVENLKDFCNTFRQLNVKSNSEIEHWINQTEAALTGADPEILRMDDIFRSNLSEQMEKISEGLCENVSILPRRKLILDDENGNAA